MTYKTINMYSNTDEHEFESLEDALVFFATDAKVKILSRYEVVDGPTAGRKTMTKERINIGIWHNDNDYLYDILGDTPDEVIIIENQTAKRHPL